VQEYHRVWLEAHPERSEEWLSDRLKDGFDIHHLDGNHSNNDPINLILIDGADHLMLHNGSKRCSRLLNPSMKVAWSPEALEKGRQAYEHFNPDIGGWSAAAQHIGLEYWDGAKARKFAERFAAANKLKWPIGPRPTNKGRKFKKRTLGHNIPAHFQART
jgi:hypothetical protein